MEANLADPASIEFSAIPSTGHIVFEGRWYSGNHEPMISVEDFNQAQKLLRGTRCRPRRYHFAYAGMIRCGNCHAAVTAQQKANRYGSRYTYYRCTRTNKTIPCREPYIEERELERQIVAIFSKQETSKTSLVQKDKLRSLLALRASSITCRTN